MICYNRRNGGRGFAGLAGLAGLLALSLSACGGPDDTGLSGTSWVLAGGTWQDTAVSGEEIEELLGGSMTYTFESDGRLTASMETGEKTASVEGTWRQSGDTVVVTSSGKEQEMEYDGESLRLEGEDMELVFERAGE